MSLRDRGRGRGRAWARSRPPSTIGVMAEHSDAAHQAHQITGPDGEVTRDRPWIIRTYSGHSSPKASNELYRSNLAKGQTGLSIAFDLPTQCGYDSDDPIARPEIGKVGVPINSLDDMHVLFDEIPIEQMNTSMTINGTAMWLLALYVALARERGVDISELTGTTQNDLIKEYLARGTYIFPPEQSLRIIAEMYEFCLEDIPSWNASNICSYHLQEAGATPTQELAFALANAISLLDLIKERGHFTEEQFERAVGRISFFVNAGIRFVEEMCKMRAFSELWDEYTRERFGVTNEKYRRFRYGVQVNSLGLTESQPENNAWRILIETLGVTLSRDARARAVQLPAWNEALSLPRPWDQQWSLRLQQILAYETDLLEYPDLFEGSVVVESKVAELKREAREEIERILDMGGVIPAIESGYMKSALVRSMSNRMSAINTGEQIVVGPEPLDRGPAVAAARRRGRRHLRGRRVRGPRRDRQRRAGTRRPVTPTAPTAALEALKAAARSGESMMEPSIECALARVTTGEWAGALREVFGEYRPATGVDGQQLGLEGDRVEALRGRVRRARRAARAPPAHRHRQARPGRPLQRRRGHRGLGPPRRLRRHLLGHPAEPRRDRAVRGRGGRRRDRRLGAQRLAPGAGPADLRQARRVRRVGDDRRGRRRHHPAGGRREADRDGCAAGLHAVGLRADRHHGVDRRADRGTHRAGRRRVVIARRATVR